MAIAQTRKMIYLGLMVGLAMGLHVFEMMLPIPYLFPGAKLGLANIITLFVVINFGVKEAIIVSFLRTVLTSLLIGTFFNITFFLSFSGAIVSALVMGLVYRVAKQHLSLVGISIIGALAHNIAQVAVASQIVGTYGIFVYLPHLLFFSLPTGLFVGMVTRQMNKHYQTKTHFAH